MRFSDKRPAKEKWGKNGKGKKSPLPNKPATNHLEDLRCNFKVGKLYHLKLEARRVKTLYKSRGATGPFWNPILPSNFLLLVKLEQCPNREYFAFHVIRSEDVGVLYLRKEESLKYLNPAKEFV